MKICPEFISKHPPVLMSKIGSRSIKLMEDVEVFGVKLPKGYISDGGSIPRFAWTVDSPFTDGMLAYLVHDYRYTNIEDSTFTRRHADWELLCNLEHCGLNIVRRILIYMAVSTFGGVFWKRNRAGRLKYGLIKHYTEQTPVKNKKTYPKKKK